MVLGFLQELSGVLCCSRHRTPEGNPLVADAAIAGPESSPPHQDPGKCKVRLAGVRQDEQSCGCTEEAPSTSSTEAPEAPVEVESVTPLHAFLDLSESVEQDHQVHQPRSRFDTLDNFLSGV
mmetsp:Transcript_65934/g.136499  ORF Transcript_65934/g.136499 Transcript_65934/m.136499 type:complete len:122 (-) Transcript_65934:168-533(-)